MDRSQILCAVERASQHLKLATLYLEDGAAGSDPRTYRQQLIAARRSLAPAINFARGLAVAYRSTLPARKAPVAVKPVSQPSKPTTTKVG